VYQNGFKAIISAGSKLPAEIQMQRKVGKQSRKFFSPHHHPHHSASMAMQYNPRRRT
jgi:hypothetical protein